MQKINLIGNLGKDPEERFTQGGAKVVSFSLAVNLSKDVVVWYDIGIWEERLPMFESILKFLKKGSRVYIQGDLLAPEVFQTKSNELKTRLRVNPFSMSFVGGEKKEPEEQKKSVFEYADTEIPF